VDLGAARLTAVDAERQVARAAEFRAAKSALDDAIRSCRIASTFAAVRAGQFVQTGYLEVRHVHEQRRHALGLKSHGGRVKALQALTEYVRKL
jgi:hypothetical protein